MKNTRTKKILCLLLAGIFLLSGVTAAYAGGTEVNPTPNTDAVKTALEGIATNIVGVVQGIFGILAVIFMIWAGIMFWGAHGDPQKITNTKRALGGFIIAIICVFFADDIVGMLLGIFGAGK